MDNLPAQARRMRSQLSQDLRFLKSWAASPLRTGAVSPSSRELAERMAQEVDPANEGMLVELGPGTGSITQALVARGFPAERLLLVEANPKFCAMLRLALPGATIVQGDAYRLGEHIKRAGDPELAGVVTGLPLLTRPVLERARLINDALALMKPGLGVVQFSYAFSAPLPMGHGDYVVTSSKWVWRNLPPARVWTYRRPSA